jgi:hypothetical protein
MKLSLHEEYLTRNKADVPIVLYEKKTFVILKSTEGPLKWRSLAINWRRQEAHPGSFEVEYSQVVHNGFDKNSFFIDIFNPQSWSWSMYEESILILVEAIKKEKFIAAPKHELYFACWEAFLTMTDAWLSRNMNSFDFFHHVLQSIKKDRSLAERLESLQRAEEMIRDVDSIVYELWAYKIKPFSKNNENEWLVRLING